MHEGFASTSDPFGFRGGLKEGTKGCSIRTEDINAKGVPKVVFVATGLAMWLSSFVFPTSVSNTIRVEMLALACRMGAGEEWQWQLRKLASIER